jgi:hypothetical protein
LRGESERLMGLLSQKNFINIIETSSGGGF